MPEEYDGKAGPVGPGGGSERDTVIVYPQCFKRLLKGALPYQTQINQVLRAIGRRLIAAVLKDGYPASSSSSFPSGLCLEQADNLHLFPAGCGYISILSGYQVQRSFW